MKLRSRHQIRKSQYRELINLISLSYEDAAGKLGKKKLELAAADEYKMLLVDGEPLFFFIEEQPCFTVRGALKLQPAQKRVFMDAGAVPFIIKGADIMRPGIVSVDPDIKEGDIVIIIENAHGKPLAVGRALVSGSDMLGNSGKVIKNLHYVGDELWNFQV